MFFLFFLEKKLFIYKIKVVFVSNKLRMFKKLLFTLLVFSCLFGGTLSAQENSSNVAIAKVKATTLSQGYLKSDLNNLELLSKHDDEKLGITYVYLQQKVGDLPIYNAIATVVINDGKAGYVSHSLIPNVKQKLTSVVPKINADKAVQLAAAEVGEQFSAKLVAAKDEKKVGRLRFYQKTTFGNDPIGIEDFFFVTKNNEIRRSYAIHLDQIKGHHHWEVIVDAENGAIIDKFDNNLKCSFTHGAYDVHSADAPCETNVTYEVLPLKTNTATVVDNAKYKVFGWPAESPLWAAHEIEQNPADSVASPYGWHDDDGVAGAEYTYTRGNNTHTYMDTDDDNEPDSVDKVDGGADLNFDFPWSEDVSPYDQTESSRVNLFYAVNKMHDFAYHYGLTEAAGNFQQKNYTNQGLAGDYVLAECQDGAKTNTSTSPNGDHINNANFATPVDGGNGRMQMYLWNRSGTGASVRADSPSDVKGETFGDMGTASTGWGVGVIITDSTDVVAGVVDARDAISDPSKTDACSDLINGGDITGKIAMIDRGGCEFGAKALRAQKAGAIAVIICNFEDATIGMSGGSDGDEVTIPTIMFTRTGCQRIRALAQQYPDFKLEFKAPSNTVSGPSYFDGSLDNGVIAHEFGHGISTRLTGSASNSGCLRNEEQMGEGWSDFFALVTSTHSGMTAEQRRGIGTYVSGETTNGTGIRNYPYSRDMSINPVTYEDVANSSFSVPHGVGSIWCSMLWDIYWDMVDEHGFSDDLLYGNGGNNKTIHLVMRGFKLQGCSPGFINGRDAILAADSILSADTSGFYGKSNKLLLWKAFARRGLGVDADQGATTSRSDGKAGYLIPSQFLNKAYVYKTVTPTIEKDEDVSVNIQLINWLDDDVKNARVMDKVPAGATINDNGAGAPYTINGDAIVFEVASMSKGDTLNLTYTFTPPTGESVTYYQELIEDTSVEGEFESENFLEGSSANLSYWEVADDEGFGDKYSFWSVGHTIESRPYLAYTSDNAILVQGDVPMFSFYHKYDINSSIEGTIIEIKTVDDSEYTLIPEDKIKRGEYSGDIGYRAFVIPNLKGYTGKQEEWTQVLIDLSDYAGKKIQLRWRHGIGEKRTDGTDGWRLDHFQQVDAFTFNEEVTVEINGQVLKTKAPNVGTYVKPNGMVSTEDVKEFEELGLLAYPNPVGNVLNLKWNKTNDVAGVIEVYNITGKKVMDKTVDAFAGQDVLDIHSFNSGMYTIKLVLGNSVQTTKVVKN